MRRILSALVLILPGLAAADDSTETRCTQVPTHRAVPGGDTVPAFRLECEEAQVDADAAGAACGARDLPPERVDDCERAAARAEAARRKASLRAALREGVDEDDLLQRFDASPEELDRLRESAVRSAPN